MQRLVTASLMLLGLSSNLAYAAPSQQTVIDVFFSVVQIHVEDKNGEHGAGSGVVVSPDHIATNCHVLANARGIVVSQGEENFIPIALKPDWRHDLCLLKFDQLPLKPVTLGESSRIRYEQPIFSLGHSGGSVAPLNSIGAVKALYPMDGSAIIRTSARFSLGASGSALFDDTGSLIGINTFKSPGHNGYFYALPVEWVRNLLAAPEISVTTPSESPFWDAPEEKRPYFMRIVPPLQAEQWETLHQIADSWSRDEENNAEAWYCLGLTESRQGRELQATEHLRKALELNPQHAGALFEIGMIAAHQGNKNETRRIRIVLNELNVELAEEFQKAAGCNMEC